jgi:hypothetical protein
VLLSIQQHSWRRSLSRVASAFRRVFTKMQSIILRSTDLGEQDLRNIARPLRVYRLNLGPVNSLPTAVKRRFP